ncbi:DUF4376 domain-containing protein [Selenomonadales bacterium OttesenSCG-928-I06]|nr:DUF4376 domain-containing protein [Selenomonadales bacterium OttesenSCG-928-I06]
MMNILNKPYTNPQYAEFAHLANQDGKRIEITEMAAYMLAENEILENNEIVDISNTKEYKDQKIVKAKDQKWQEIKNIRDAKEREPFFYLEKYFDFDNLASERLNWAISAARSALEIGEEFSVEWTCADNTTILLNAAQILNIPFAVAQRTVAVHSKARQYRQQIEEATTTKKVEKIVWEDEVDAN